MLDNLSFDDVLISPAFSFVRSRKDVSLRQELMNYVLELPVISSNMDTITESKMAQTMGQMGGVGALHRFCTIEENIAMFKAVNSRNPIVSIGVSKEELERAEALVDAGATHLLIDVNHGAAIQVVNQFDELQRLFGTKVSVVVGNFANKESIETFNYHVQSKRKPAAFKVGIGGGSMCTTRIVTGIGMPTLATVMDCAKTRYPIIADGGLRNSGDIAKALAAGASAVMLGGMLSGTHETPGQIVDNFYKEYRGSASQESYKKQGKTASHRSAEGTATRVPYKGSVVDVLEQISGGLRGSLSMVGAINLQEFREKVQFIKITGAGMVESRPHGKKD